MLYHFCFGNFVGVGALEKWGKRGWALRTTVKRTQMIFISFRAESTKMVSISFWTESEAGLDPEDHGEA